MKIAIIIIAIFLLITSGYAIISNLLDFLKQIKSWEESMDKRYGNGWKKWKH